MNQLVQILYFISTVLLAPVIITLLAFLAWSVLELGGFIREWRERCKGIQAWQRFTGEVQKGNNTPETALMTTFFERGDYAGLLGIFASQGKEIHRRPMDLGRLVADLEIEASRRLSRMSIGAKLAPMLGLMGTLIPMGPALIGLSKGDIEEMATNLVVAFSTTVLGLLVGGLCHLIIIFRRRWYAQDLSDTEYVYQCLHGEESK